MFARATHRLLIAALGALAFAWTVNVTAQGPPSSVQTPTAAPAAAPAPPSSSACAALAGRTFAAGTTITAATMVMSGSLKVSDRDTIENMPPFCRVEGVSRPSADSDIRFEVWLPQTWNGKFMSTGEGAFAGRLNYTRNGNDAAMDEQVRRGYATASTDTGHRAGDGWWAVGHPEKAADYLYRAKHVVTVAAKQAIAAFYGRGPSHSYFNSCSNGGRQGLIEAQRYPEDFDGLIIGAPWNFQSHSNAGFVWNGQAMSAPGAAIPREKLPAINAAVLAACDRIDGVADGVLTDPRSCAFTPETLRCKGDDTNLCLTAPQVAALKKVYDGPTNPRTGAQVFPGFAMGSEAGWSGIVRAPDTASGLVSYFSNIVYQDPKWDYRTFDFDRDMAFSDEKAGRLGNAIATDYSAAKQRGVKIIQYHGWNDQTLQPAYSPAYFEQVAAANGGIEKTQEFYRLFMVPGMNHCSGGVGASNFGGVGQQLPTVRDAAHDLQLALERWVEQGISPDQFIGTAFTDNQAATRTVKFTRPICLYPAVATYKGSGDPTDAASFSCIAP
jgi:feruloyl esterase